MNCPGCRQPFTRSRAYAGGLECLNCHRGFTALAIIKANWTPNTDPKAWARKILELEAKGQYHSAYGLQCAKEALRS